MEYLLNSLLFFYFLSPETNFAEIIENFETGRVGLLSFRSHYAKSLRKIAKRLSPILVVPSDSLVIPNPNEYS
ncbi:MAG: hypothetical protein ABIK99_03595 [candidate division WOR-3 bacterium]